MKSYLTVLLGILIFSCQSSREKARKPQESLKVTKTLEPISEKIIANSVLYEANIRQYSNEGTFNAFTKDLHLLKKMGVKILWLMPINPISKTKSNLSGGRKYRFTDKLWSY